VTSLDEGVFEAKLLSVDADGGQIVLSRHAQEALNSALLQRSLCSFHASVPGRHIEFAATEPRDLGNAIQLKFPEVMVSRQERAHPRAEVTPHRPLHCVADAAGIMPFEARMIDISRGGAGFLVYPGDIILEPGTVLHGCRIQGPDGRTYTVDLEVRYSQPVTLKDGTRAARSGCRFVDPSPDVLELVRHYVGD